MGVRIRIRDRQMHQQLKADLVEHIWRQFGRDEDNKWVRMFFQIILDYCTSLYFYVFLTFMF